MKTRLPGQHRRQSVTGDFDYVIKRQRRKSMALHVLPDATVEVRVPKWVPRYEIVNFVEQRSDWVLERRKQTMIKLAAQPDFRHGQYHSYLGQKYPLQVAQGGRASVTFSDNILSIKVRDPDSAGQIERALGQWYRKQATDIFEQRMLLCFNAFPQWFQQKFTKPDITVRKMRRRWGSCSRTGDVTLNVLLIKMPQECIDYVISHELCHLQAFHHGKAFYSLLATVMPDYRQLELQIEQLSEQ